MESDSFSALARSAARDGFVTGSLASRVVERLLSKIREEDLASGTRLPSEKAMAAHFGVSRTVIREAIALLKADGVLETRRGSGTFVVDPEMAQGLYGDRLTDQSVQALLNLIEVRRTIDAETAALAAVRRSPGQLAQIEHSLRRIAAATAAGSDGVDEDAQFHRSIAAATGNPYWVRFNEMFARQIHSAVKVTRANDRREDLTRQVMDEHENILAAIAAGDAEAAGTAAAEHMEHAAERVRTADSDFWHGEGGRFARDLTRNDPNEKKTSRNLK